ncbi:hypothetical protein [Peptoclostridium litorale]|uniref:hypothetical protein n=1 Tax=Peptoclostridium litorale TaxID=1557 RepID=UPI0011614EE8|nr:hypothetical protein [Peptoclostridium litorale]
MDKKIISNIILTASLINIICMVVSLFKSRSFVFISIAFFISIAHVFIISTLSNEKKLLEGTTNEYVMDSIDDALFLNKLLLGFNMVFLAPLYFFPRMGHKTTSAHP